MDIIKNILKFVNYIFHLNPFYLPLIIASSMLKSALTLLSLYFISELIDVINLDFDFYNTVNVAFSFIVSSIIISIVYIYLTQKKIPLSLKRLQNRMQVDVMDKISSLNYSCYENTDDLNCIKEAQQQAVERISEFSSTIAIFITNIFSIGGLITLLISYSPIAILIASVSVIVSLGLNIKKVKDQHFYYKKSVPFERFMDFVLRSNYNRNVARDIRLYSKFKAILKEKFAYYANCEFELSDKYAKKCTLGSIITYTCNQFVNLILVVILSLRVLHNNLSIGEFIASINGFQQLTTQVLSLIQIIPEFYKHSIYISNFLNFMNGNSKTETITGGKHLSSNLYIQFDHVYFKYPNTERYAIEDLSFTLKQGDRILIVGNNGAGKSTIINLMTRLYVPTMGCIKINGIDYLNYDLEELRNCFSTLFQDNVFYPLSVQDNILMGRPLIEYDQIPFVLKTVELSESINQFVEKSNVMVTKEFDDNGIILSGGEYQRLAIARSVFRLSTILFLDEPLNSLDPIVGRKILYHILNDCKKLLSTVIIVSHDLSFAQDMDNIICMQSGKCVAIGKHDELLNNCSYYQELCEAHKSIKVD